MADGTTQQDYLDIIQEIVSRKSIIITRINYDKVDIRALVANMTDEAIDAVLDNPKVATLSRRIRADPERSPDESRIGRRQPTLRPKTNIGGPNKLHERALTLPGRFGRFFQAGALFDDPTTGQVQMNRPPFHLSWLTSLWAMTGLRQSSQDQCKCQEFTWKIASH